MMIYTALGDSITFGENASSVARAYPQLSLRDPQAINPKYALASYQRNLGAIIREIKANSHARIVCCTQYNPFPNSPLAAAAIHQLNRATQDMAHRYHVGLAPVHTWFEGRQPELIHGYRNGSIEDSLSGSLPIHPNDYGHRTIAHGLANYIIPKRG